MADVKISQLPTITNASLGATSIIPLVDSTDSTTKSISFPQLDTRWMSNPMTTSQDLIIGGTGGVPTRFGIGAEGLVLGVNSGLLAWVTGGGGGGGTPASVAVPNTTPWAAYTMVVSSTGTSPTLGTSSMNSAEWRQVGDSIQIRWDVSLSGSGNSAGTGNYLFSLPNGYSIDNTKIAFSGGTGSFTPGTSGVFSYQDSSGNGVAGYTAAWDATHFIAVGVDEATGSAFATLPIGNSFLQFQNTIVQRYSLTIQLPIVGLANSTTYTLGSLPVTTPLKSQIRVYAPSGYGSTNTSIRTFSSVDIGNTYGSDITYNPSASLGDSFTINTAGTYIISRFDYSSSAAAEYGLSRNSTQLSTPVETISFNAYLGMVINSTTAGVPAVGICVPIYLNAGDIIRAHDAGGQNGTSDRACMTISRVASISGTTAVVPTPVNFSGYLNPNQSVTAGAPIIIDTKTADSTNSYSTSTGFFTAPELGFYLCSFMGAVTTGTANVGVYVNGAFKTSLITVNPSSENSGTVGVQVNMGDTISFCISTSNTFFGSGGTAASSTNVSICLVR